MTKRSRRFDDSGRGDAIPFSHGDASISWLGSTRAGLVLMATATAAVAGLPRNGTEGMSFFVFGHEHKARFTWSADNRDIYMRLNAADFATHKCADAWFDWRTEDDRHYDNRHIRICQPRAERQIPHDGLNEHTFQIVI